MKCKVFKIHLENDLDESELNRFLENAAVSQIFSSIVNSEIPFWSVLILYEDKIASPTEKPRRLNKAEELETPYTPDTFALPASKTPAPKSDVKTVDFAPEPIKLTAEQENSYNALRNWRNDRASRDGVPPYLITHNDSLMQMATMTIESPEDLLQVKGLGEKRVEKYDDEILRILSSIES
jgi:superfamily II DNA helicase RecQ